MKDFKTFFEKGPGLWANIHKKRKEGRPMRKPGSKGAPTKQDFERSRSENLQMDIKKKLKKIKGLTKDQLTTLSAMNPSTLQVIINQLSTIVNQNEAVSAAQQAAIAIAKKKSGKYDKDGKKIDEALVANNSDIVSAILNQLQPYFAKGLNNDDEKRIAHLNAVGKHVNMGVTRKRQAKNRTFLYKLKK
tara:strand:- start:6721 stop:7287 length:567 start_codon:yes stop_codon:yes gene_type:complete